MKRLIAGAYLMSCTGGSAMAGGGAQPMPINGGPQDVPALGGWGLGLLAVAVGGIVYRWFRSRDHD